MRWLDEEEQKLTEGHTDTVLLMDQKMPGGVATAQSLHTEQVLTYEDYYDIDDLVPGSRRKAVKTAGKIPFEDYVAKMASENIFENDLLEQQYKFWESTEDRQQRLQRIWLDLKRKNALGGVDAVTTEETRSLNSEIAELLRRIRWRTDQELTRRNIEPVFKEHYAGKYSKAEMLTDAGFEFWKVKSLLSKNPKLLKDDPVLNIDYYKIINLVRRKKLLENTSHAYAPEDQSTAVWNDLDLVQKDRYERERLEYEKYMRSEEYSVQQSEAAVSERMDMDKQDQEVEETIKATKKKENKDHQKIVLQFDKLATQFARTQGANSTQLTTSKMGGAKAETAGLLKKKTKKRKEKSLSAKLRLREKKGGSEDKK